MKILPELTQLAKNSTSISLCKLLMAFLVVVTHFRPTTANFVSDFLLLIRPCAVPCFMFLTFYLTKELFVKHDTQSLKKCLCRLYLPVVFWNLIFFIAAKIHYFTGTGSKVHSIKLFYAFTLGHAGGGLNSQTWYLIDAIFCLCVIFLAFSVIQSTKNRVIFLILAIIFAFFMQYKGINFYYFDKAPYESRFPLGRFCEVLPYASLGTLYFMAKDKIRVPAKIAIFAVSLLGYFAVTQFFHVPRPQGFYYQGLQLFFLSICCISFFLTLPQIKNECIAFWINFIAQFTMGIYCMHVLVGRELTKLFAKNAFTQTYSFDLLIFTVCLVIALIFWRLFYKIKFLRNMFC